MFTRALLASLMLAPLASSQLPAAGGGGGFASASSTHAVRDVAANVRQAYAGGRWVVFAHDEAGVDQNGDGDATDRVYAVHDLVSGATTELGLAGDRAPAFSGDGRALVAVRESQQGASDLNGNGNANDFVAFGVDLATGASETSRLAVGETRFVGERAVLVVLEAAQATDLDGNGVLGGSVCFVWESFDQEPEAIPLAMASPVASHESYLLFPVMEALAGDKNGDGDSLDHVLHAVDLDDPSRTPVNTGLAVGAAGIAARVVAAGPRSAFLVHELRQDADLNSDGDLNDTVLHVFDVGGPLLENTGLAVGAQSVPVGHGLDVRGPDLAMKEDALAFAVSETAQDEDLNGDGRLLGSVLFVRDFAAGTTTSLGLPVYEFALGDGFVAFDVIEESYDADLDGDGRIEGHVAHVHELATGVTTNLGVRPTEFFPADAPFAFRGEWLALPGFEDGVDQNGDGDGDDSVLQLLHLSTLSLESQHVAVDFPLNDSSGAPRFTFSADGWLSFHVPEAAEGGDLNGDGDFADFAVHFLKPGAGLRVETTLDAFQRDPLLAGFGRRHPVLDTDRVLRVVRLRE